MNIVILGCGPAGLMAAQAVRDAAMLAQAHVNIMIFSRREKSALYGAQYLHEPIPEISPPDAVRVAYRLEGDSADYRRKVYGPMWDGTVSPEDLEDAHYAWDIRATYDRLWLMWSPGITEKNVTPAEVNRIKERHAPDLIINSIPRPALCYRGHTFGYAEIIAAGDAPALGIRVPFVCPDNTVVCNGLDNPSWYRMSRVFGHTTVEWPISVGRVPMRAATVQKPTYHACDCFSDVFHVGRYGTWQKGVLSHTAYFNSFNKVLEMLDATAQAKA